MKIYLNMCKLNLINFLNLLIGIPISKPPEKRLLIRDPNKTKTIYKDLKNQKHKSNF